MMENDNGEKAVEKLELNSGPRFDPEVAGFLRIVHEGD